jgi:hypothetical protein
MAANRSRHPLFRQRGFAGDVITPASSGATIDFLLSAKRDAAAAERFLAKALGGANHPHPSGHQHRQVCRLPAGDCATK